MSTGAETISPPPLRVLVTGAAGNLGSRFARHLLSSSSHRAHLMFHRVPLPNDLAAHPSATPWRCDLADPATLRAACAEADVIVHFAGVLFAPGPERFLPVTNTLYTRNLVAAAIEAGVKRFVLVSFPHVEGPTGTGNPCTDRLDGRPVSVHAETRLEAERHLMERGAESGLEAIALRPGMVYGRDILMIDYARRLAARRLLGVWRTPTPIHLVSLEDFNAACLAACVNPEARGIYPLGDDDPTTLQEFLDACCDAWQVPRPWRVPVPSVYAVAWLCETAARLLGTRTPFTVDFIRIGRVPYLCDTTRMKRELLPRLAYPSWRAGLVTV